MNDDDQIWPPGTEPEPEKLLSLAEELAEGASNEASKESVAEIRRELEAAKKIAEAPVFLRDLPESCLDGRLGEICRKRLSDFPLAYSWPALLATASALIDRRADGVRTNLFVALVGRVHTGKSQAIDRATKILGVESPVLLDVMSGSAEALVRKCKDASGNPRLFSPDELGHTLEKMRIEHSSFAFVLNSAYYRDRFEVLLGRKENATFHCALSIIGGLVEDRFQELFNAATCGGLYDRFLFGLCPGNFQYDYRPFEGPREDTQPACVHIDPSVWELKSAWLKEFSNWNARVVEIGIRAATVCAAFDGRPRLLAEHLDPHLELIRYQNRIRSVLRPNPGETIEGRLAHKFLDYLARHNGAYVPKRKLYRDTRAYDFGPTTADRALSVLIANGDVGTTKVGRKEFVRLMSEAEPLQEGNS